MKTEPGDSRGSFPDLGIIIPKTGHTALDAQASGSGGNTFKILKIVCAVARGAGIKTDRIKPPVDDLGTEARTQRRQLIEPGCQGRNLRLQQGIFGIHGKIEKQMISARPQVLTIPAV